MVMRRVAALRMLLHERALHGDAAGRALACCPVDMSFCCLPVSTLLNIVSYASRYVFLTLQAHANGRKSRTCIISTPCQ